MESPYTINPEKLINPKKLEALRGLSVDVSNCLRSNALYLKQVAGEINENVGKGLLRPRIEELDKIRLKVGDKDYCHLCWIASKMGKKLPAVIQSTDELYKRVNDFVFNYLEQDKQEGLVAGDGFFYKIPDIVAASNLRMRFINPTTRSLNKTAYEFASFFSEAMCSLEQFGYLAGGTYESLVSEEIKRLSQLEKLTYNSTVELSKGIKSTLSPENNN